MSSPTIRTLGTAWAKLHYRLNDMMGMQFGHFQILLFSHLFEKKISKCLDHIIYKYLNCHVLNHLPSTPTVWSNNCKYSHIEGDKIKWGQRAGSGVLSQRHGDTRVLFLCTLPSKDKEECFTDDHLSFSNMDIHSPEVWDITFVPSISSIILVAW